LDNRGSVLIPVLVVCLVFVSTLAAQFQESRMEMMINQNLLSQKKLFYLAEAGLVKGFWKIGMEKGWDPGGEFFQLGDKGGFVLEIYKNNGEKFLLSKGVKGEETRVLSAKYKVREKDDSVEVIWWKEGYP